MTPFLFVHGDYHGAWCWDLVRAKLPGRATTAVDLPSSGPVVAELGTRRDDVDVLRTAVDSAPEPVTVVVHSASGIATAEALAGSSHVRGVIFLAAVVLERGQTIVDVLGHSDMSWADVHADEGYVRAAAPLDAFYADADEHSAQSAVDRLTYKSAADLLAPATVAVADWGWPSAYVVCDHDRAISPTDERAMARRTGAQFALPSSHSPFLSMPGTLAALLATIDDTFERT